jgi:beta-phosphoglucomutase family hydrolase
LLKAVIFDMDGVIIDSEPAHIRLEGEIFKELGIEVTEEEHHSFVGTNSYYMWEVIKNKCNLAQTVEELVQNDRDRYFNDLVSEKCETEMITGVTELIKDLYENGLSLAVASSSPLDVIETVVKKFNIDKYFKILVTGDYVERSKPEPDIFLLAAERLQVEPSECLVIEDSHNGVCAARKAGMKCIGYKNLNSGSQDISMADSIVDTFDNLDADTLSKLFNE